MEYFIWISLISKDISVMFQFVIIMIFINTQAIDLPTSIKNQFS